MEASAALSSAQGFCGTKVRPFSFYGMSSVRYTVNVWSHNSSQRFGGSLISSTMNNKSAFLLPIKASETSQGVTSDSISEKSIEGQNKRNLNKTTFPSGFEALMLEVCDETNIAELKLKVGNFEMHLKRDIASARAPSHIVSPVTVPPIPSEPMVDSGAPSPPATPEKSSPSSANPFAKAPPAKASKLAALNGIGTNAYVLVHSPTVGSFRRGRTIKGKKQAPICKEGDTIKEGQVIGYLDQFGTELPVKSDVAGEVIKLLYKEGEPVGYGDPLIAVLPSFHDIQ
ncbi:uncharacterized protein LOC116262230 isoform X2 [Nymphaea colorata]|uniref:uncharacterized protein LOC116262230 isoform X2 n=1 Tax=Nymphaea colorata TaxID=210225 RepID=UPI00129DDFBC|nr:uncharacterized protein LOC116262230 isoform X2 [Nymphaea colorata]